MAEHKKDQVNPDLSAADAADDVSHAGDDAIDAVDEVSRVVDEMSKVTGMMDGLLSDDSPVPSSTTTDANAGNTASDNIEELLKDTSLVADPTAANNNDAESIDDLPELLGDLDAEIAEAEASIGELLDTLESVGDAGESTQTSEASERTSTTDPETSVDPDLVPASESESLVAEAAEAQESLSTSDAAAESVLDGFNETGNLDDAQADGVDEGLESVESSDVQNDDGVSETQPDLAELDGADDPEQQESFKESEDAQDLVEAEPVETAADMGADPIDEASALENTEEFDDSFDDVSEDALAEVEAELVRAPESADEIAAALATHAAPDELDSLDSELAELGDMLLDDNFGQPEPDPEPELEAVEETVQDDIENDSVEEEPEPEPVDETPEPEDVAVDEPAPKPRRAPKPKPQRVVPAQTPKQQRRKLKELSYEEILSHAKSTVIAFLKHARDHAIPMLKRVWGSLCAKSPVVVAWCVQKVSDASQFVTAKLDARWPIARKAVGSMAVATFIYAVLLWGYVLFVRKPVPPQPKLEPATVDVEPSNRLGTQEPS